MGWHSTYWRIHHLFMVHQRWTLKRMINIKAKNLIISGAVIFIALGFFFAGTSSLPNLVETDKVRTMPDYIITNINAKKYDESGALRDTFTATYALHDNLSAQTLLDNPKVKRHELEGTWHATAKKGIIEDGSHDILLTGNAVAAKQFSDSPDIILNADSIHYLDSNQSLTSSGHASLYSTQGKTTAKVITTYINSEKVVITDSVRGQYETTH